MADYYPQDIPLPQVSGTPAAPPSPADGGIGQWNSMLGGLGFGQLTPGGGAWAPGTAPTPSQPAGPAAQPAVPGSIQTFHPGTVQGQELPQWWNRIVLDLEVYGFLFLLVGIGLYGLFAPQINVAVQKAGKAAALAV